MANSDKSKMKLDPTLSASKVIQAPGTEEGLETPQNQPSVESSGVVDSPEVPYFALSAIFAAIAKKPGFSTANPAGMAQKTNELLAKIGGETTRSLQEMDDSYIESVKHLMNPSSNKTDLLTRKEIISFPICEAWRDGDGNLPEINWSEAVPAFMNALSKRQGRDEGRPSKITLTTPQVHWKYLKNPELSAENVSNITHFLTSIGPVQAANSQAIGGFISSLPARYMTDDSFNPSERIAKDISLAENYFKLDASGVRVWKETSLMSKEQISLLLLSITSQIIRAHDRFDRVAEVNPRAAVKMAGGVDRLSWIAYSGRIGARTAIDFTNTLERTTNPPTTIRDYHIAAAAAMGEGMKLWHAYQDKIAQFICDGRSEVMVDKADQLWANAYELAKENFKEAIVNPDPDYGGLISSILTRSAVLSSTMSVVVAPAHIEKFLGAEFIEKFNNDTPSEVYARFVDLAHKTIIRTSRQMAEGDAREAKKIERMLRESIEQSFLSGVADIGQAINRVEQKPYVYLPDLLMGSIERLQKLYEKFSDKKEKNRELKSKNKEISNQKNS